MDLVVIYDYYIDNKEEMKMDNVRLKDTAGDEAEVSILTKNTETIKKVVVLDLDPYEQELVSIMHYTPEQARKLAAALIMAAEEAEK